MTKYPGTVSYSSQHIKLTTGIKREKQKAQKSALRDIYIKYDWGSEVVVTKPMDGYNMLGGKIPKIRSLSEVSKGNYSFLRLACKPVWKILHTWFTTISTMISLYNTPLCIHSLTSRQTPQPGSSLLAFQAQGEESPKSQSH